MMEQQAYAIAVNPDGMPDYLKEPPLNPKHRKMLEKESGIDPEVVAERGYRTVTSRSELAEEYKKYQRRAPSLYVPMYSPCGRTSSQLRADKPRIDKDGKPIKYDTPGDASAIIDAHPRVLEALQSRALHRRWVTEGVRKGDALVSLGELAISLAGVWNFKVKGQEKLLPGWDTIAIEGQLFYIVYDSDIMTKPEVAQALDRLARLLTERGAIVHAVYMPDGTNGEKVGVDDFLAAGNTIEDLLSYARLYDPADYIEIRLARNPELAQALHTLGGVHGALPMKTRGDATAQSVYRVLLKRAKHRGRSVEEGVEVVAAVRDVAQAACVGNATATRYLRKLIEAGLLIKKDPADRKKGAHYTLTLPLRSRERSTGTQWREGSEKEKMCSTQSLFSYSIPEGRAPQNPHNNGGVDVCVPVLRGVRDDVGEFRWSAPGRKPSEAERRASRLGETQVPLTETREAVIRLGKRRGAMVAFILNRGGPVPIEDLLAEFASPSTRKRDFIRRQLLPLTAPPVLSIDGETVSVTEEWRSGLRLARSMAGEQEANKLQAERIAREREARRLNVKVDEVPETPLVSVLPIAYHPKDCACWECAKEFGAVVGEHVENCQCLRCLAARDGRPTPEDHKILVEADPQPEPMAEAHDPFCDCWECMSAPKYVKPWGGS